MNPDYFRTCLEAAGEVLFLNDSRGPITTQAGDVQTVLMPLHGDRKPAGIQVGAPGEKAARFEKARQAAEACREAVAVRVEEVAELLKAAAVAEDACQYAGDVAEAAREAATAAHQKELDTDSAACEARDGLRALQTKLAELDATAAELAAELTAPAMAPEAVTVATAEAAADVPAAEAVTVAP